MKPCVCTPPARSINPRKQGSCEACGFKLPPSPEPTRRVLETERELTRMAAKGIVDPEPLITHSETRCQQLSGEYTPDPMLLATGRDFKRDAREEAADLRSYVVFWLQENPESEDRQQMFFALRHCCILYDLLKEDA